MFICDCEKYENSLKSYISSVGDLMSHPRQFVADTKFTAKRVRRVLMKTGNIKLPLNAMFINNKMAPLL